MPSGLSARTSSAEVSDGTTVTRQPDVNQAPQNVALDAVIISHYMMCRLRGAAGEVGGRARLHRRGPFVALAAW